MKNEKEIRAQIQRVTKDYRHVLDCGPATVGVNAPRALMQSNACAILDVLYCILGAERPKFKADDYEKVNT